MPFAMFESFLEWLGLRTAGEVSQTRVYELFWKLAEEEKPQVGAFKSFLKWALEKRPQNLLARISENQEDWWNDQAHPDRKDAINKIERDTAAQGEFIEWVKQWAA